MIDTSDWRRYGHCEDCRRAFERAAPQMHRLDHTPAHDGASLGVRSRDDAEECEGPADEGESPKANAVMPAMVVPVVWCHSSICVDAALEDAPATQFAVCSC